jgi:hypothetical protein
LIHPEKATKDLSASFVFDWGEAADYCVAKCA